MAHRLCRTETRGLLGCSRTLHACRTSKTQINRTEFPCVFKCGTNLRNVQLLQLYIALDTRAGIIKSDWNGSTHSQPQRHVTHARVEQRCNDQLLMNSRDFSVSTYVTSECPRKANQQIFQNVIDINTVYLHVKPCNLKTSSNANRQNPAISATSSPAAANPSPVSDHKRVELSDKTEYKALQSVPEIVQTMYNALQRKDNQEFGYAFCLYSKVSGTASPKRDPSWMKATPTQLSVVLLRLREELPAFFDYPHSMGLYSKQLIVENGLFGPVITTRGQFLYRLQLRLFKFCANIRFAQPAMEILKITKESEQSSIHVRWRVKGMPLIQLIGVKTQERVWDGFSIFEVANDGLIRRHKITRVTPTRVKEKAGFVAALMALWQLGPKQEEEFC